MQCLCGICGKEKQVIGYQTSEVLDVEPAKYFVQVTKREKRACKGCEEGGVSCAPLPGRIIAEGLGSDRVVIDGSNRCVETCRRLQVPVRAYLNAVFPGLENFPANRVK